MFLIVIPIKDLLENKMFGSKGFDLYNLKSQLTEFYSYGPFKPNVEINDEYATVEIDDDSIMQQDDKFRKAVAFCEKGKYHDAIPILSNLIKANPRNSEYNRLYGQILSMSGKHDEGEKYLLEAIKWDYNNHWAFIMLGNIYARQRNDLGKAMLYYDRALKIKPEDNILLNNIGANYAQRDQNDKALEFFNKALEADKDYPNTYYGIALISFRNREIIPAFDYSVMCMQRCKDVDDLYGQALQLAFDAAVIHIKNSDFGMNAINNIIEDIKDKTGISTKIEVDDDLGTAARVQIAENYGRDHHLVTYNSKFPAYQHLVIHELTHVLFSMKARERKSNKLFTVNEAKKEKFLADNQSTMEKLARKGYGKQQSVEFLKQFYQGLTNQLFNTPVDLFIEDYIHEAYPEIRPYQMVSLRAIVQSGVDACSGKKAVELSPTKHLSNSKIMNYVIASQYQDLYGVKMKELLNCDYNERKKGDEIYGLYKEAQKEFVPGNEYDLIDVVGEKLRLAQYYSLVDENEFRQKNPVRPEMKHESSDKTPNMAVVMYIVSALKVMLNMSSLDIRKVAYEIAEIGKKGINPHDTERKYELKSFPDKQFTGLHLLAWMYVMWKNVEPSLDTGLNYEQEYEAAMQMMKMGLGNE